VRITNFDSSWSDGLALCALVHSYNKNVFDFESLPKNPSDKNYRLAMGLLEKLEIPRLIDEQEFTNGKSPDSNTIMAYLTSVYSALEKGVSSVSGAMKKENEQAKAKLENVQNELASLRAKLRASQRTMREKETAKQQLERKVETLKLMLNSETRSKEELAQEHALKLERIEQKIATASGSTKVQLLEQLKQEKQQTQTMQEKQRELEKEMSAIEKQLKEEELKAIRLEEETKRKEEEKKKLDEQHKLKMRDLKRKLLESAMNIELTNRKIGDAMSETAKFVVETKATETNVYELKTKIDITLDDKEQISDLKKKIARELEKAKGILEDEKTQTHGQKKIITS